MWGIWDVLPLVSVRFCLGVEFGEVYLLLLVSEVEGMRR